jgi:hypothetical protein
MNTIVPVRRAMAALVAVLLLGGFALSPALCGRVWAAPQTTHHHLNWVQRHPTLTAIGAGVVTHHALKVAARNAKLHGKRLKLGRTTSYPYRGGCRRGDAPRH